MSEATEKMHRAINRLAKWRMIFAGWQLGTRTQDDPESNAVRDQREGQLIQRAELSGLTNLLISKGIITLDEYAASVTHEANELCEILSNKFPGYRATDQGMLVDAAKAAETTRGWKP